MSHASADGRSCGFSRQEIGLGSRVLADLVRAAQKVGETQVSNHISIHQSEYPFGATTCSIEVVARARAERRRNVFMGGSMHHAAYVLLRIHLLGTSVHEGAGGP